MKIAIMQPYFFPYIGYWQLINAVDKFVIYDDVNYIKGGWINRNRILISDKAKYINLQMHKASPNKLINEIEVSGDRRINNKLLKTIDHCYKKAPYFRDITPIFEDVINQREKNLAKFLTYLIRQVCEYLSIKTNILISSDLEKDNELKAQDKVIEICKILGADEYINAIGGKELYSHKEFLKHGIRLKFLETKEIIYNQFDNEFVPNLSIIDVMMFNKPDKINKMLDNYDMV